MDENTKNILRSELYAASSYIERLMHAFIDIAALSPTQEVKELCSKMSFDLESFLSNSILEDWLESDQIFTTNLKGLRTHLKVCTKLIESLLLLPAKKEECTKLVVTYINLLYRHGKDLHLLCLEKTSIEVQLPRVNLIESIGNEETSSEVPCFFLDIDRLTPLTEDKNLSIGSLEWQRQKKYDQFLQKGHEAIFNKEYDNALELFSKALNYHETAEILTLVGWAHSLLGKNEKAKSYCLKAIQKDPDYGPPYNDLGTYIMSDGQIDESLKWFELAKRAPNYQNREYPYINAGRAYMSKRNMTKALEEFSKALTLAPYHEELHQTVEKLKRSLHNKKSKEENSFFGLSDEKNSSDLPPSVFD